MIRNGRQATIARKKYQELMLAASKAEPGQDSSFLALAEDIASELAEYDAIRDGHVKDFAVNCIDDVGEALVKARIARGWTHRQLAEALGVSEQMVQKDEVRSYENAGLARVADVADALGYELVGSLRPAHALAVDSWSDTPTAGTWIIGSSFVPASNSVIFPWATLPASGAMRSYTNLSAVNTPSWRPMAHNLALDSSFVFLGSSICLSFPHSITASLRGYEDSSASVTLQESGAM